MALPLILLTLLSVTARISGKCTPGEKYASGDNTDMHAAMKFLQEYEEAALNVMYQNSLHEWNYGINLTDHNRKEMEKTYKATADFNKQAGKEATKFAWKNFKDTNETAYRVFKLLSIFDKDILPDDKINEFNKIVARMSKIHSTAKICKYPEGTPCDIPFDGTGDIEFATLKDYDRLAFIWSQYRDATGKKYKQKFLRYVELLNEAACLNGFKDAGDMWREEFEDDNIMAEFTKLWEDISPMFVQLHAHVRSKLIKRYPDKIKEDGPIPANILGEIMSAAWHMVFADVRPYPKKGVFNPEGIMQEKNITSMDKVHMAEAFFKSIGLLPMPENFWKRSIFEKKPNVEMVCHPEAQDFFKDENVGIKMCGVDFPTIHHEMGHCEYFLLYKDLPIKLRTGANSGFHEAVGDTIALSVTHPSHYKRIGLVDNYEDDPETDLNNLMLTALMKIVTVPYALILDLWRWRIFDGSIPTSDLNKEWWNYRLKYQGLCPPTLRTEEDFDAGAIHHVSNNTPFIRYFISYVIQFQFHKYLCEEAGHEGPLHKCDIYESKAAGKLLKDMLKLGASKNWREALKVLTKGRSDKIEAGPILEYFKPLIDWLKEENKKQNNTIGWKNDNPMICP